jgi:curved DNA-binding protein CbpA
MSANEFVDFYDLLQLSSNADAETIERIFRHLAKKLHPDHSDQTNNDQFIKIVEAYEALSDPVTRAGYDARYQDYWNRKWKLASVASDMSELGDDKVARERILSLLYVQRRRSMKSPGLGETEISRLLNTPLELAEFHLWYIKTKGWVERLETGHLAITALGVDQVEKSRSLRPEKLIEAHNHPHDAAEGWQASDEDLRAANE